MADFSMSYGKTMLFEGAYSNDPNDRGGETWKGIARKMHPSWKGWTLIDKAKSRISVGDLNSVLNDDQGLEIMVQDFYKTEFFEKLQLDRIGEQEIVDELFDTAVNQGKETSGKYFQAALNLLNNNQKHYSDIKEDGNIGEVTLKAYRAYMLTASFPSRSKQRNVMTLLKAINFFQLSRYVDLCRRNPGQEIYFYGWVNRV